MNKIEETSFLVTGGAGFIGSNIVEYLLKNNAKFVRVLDNLSTGHRENIEPFMDLPNFEFMEGDICDFDTCVAAVQGIDVMTHQAALGSVPRSINNPIASNLNNVTGFLNMLFAAKENGIRRFVYASSSSVYGDEPNLPKVEERTGKPLSPYAITKCVNELYADVFQKVYGIECIGLRYFNIFGPRQDPNGAYAAVIPKFVSLLLQGQSPRINGDGSYSRDFTYVDNAVQANVKAMLTISSDASGKAYNVACEKRVTIKELFDKIREELGSDIDCEFGDLRPGDVPHSLADITLARTYLSYEPTVDIDTGLKNTVQYFLDYFSK